MHHRRSSTARPSAAVFRGLSHLGASSSGFASGHALVHFQLDVAVCEHPGERVRGRARLAIAMADVPNDAAPVLGVRPIIGVGQGVPLRVVELRLDGVAPRRVRTRELGRDVEAAERSQDARVVVDMGQVVEHYGGPRPGVAAPVRRCSSTTCLRLTKWPAKQSACTSYEAEEVLDSLVVGVGGPHPPGPEVRGPGPAALGPQFEWTPLVKADDGAPRRTTPVEREDASFFPVEGRIVRHLPRPDAQRREPLAVHHLPHPLVGDRGNPLAAAAIRVALGHRPARERQPPLRWSRQRHVDQCGDVLRQQNGLAPLRVVRALEGRQPARVEPARPIGDLLDIAAEPIGDGTRRVPGAAVGNNPILQVQALGERALAKLALQESPFGPAHATQRHAALHPDPSRQSYRDDEQTYQLGTTLANRAQVWSWRSDVIGRLAPRSRSAAAASCFVLALACVLSSSGAAQSGGALRRVPSPSSCPVCALRVRRVAGLQSGDRDSLQSGPLRSAAVSGTGDIVVSYGNETAPLRVFDPSGRLRHSIARQSDLIPPSLGLLWVTAVGGEIKVFANDSGGAYSLDHVGALRRGPATRVAPFRQLAVLKNGSIVTAFVARDPQDVGLPLKLYSPDGNLITAFGSDAEYFRADSADLLRRTVTPGRGGGFWAAYLYEYRVEYWSDAPARTLTLVRNPPWFSGVGLPRPLGLAHPPPPVLTGVYEDRLGLLWTATAVARTDWQSAVQVFEGGAVDPRGPSPPLNDLYETIVEVLDPKAGRVVTALRIPVLLSAQLGDRLFLAQREVRGVGFYLDVYEVTLDSTGNTNRRYK